MTSTGDNFVPSYNQPGDVQPTLWTVAPRPNVVNNYQHRVSKSLGITLVVVGSLSLIFGIVLVAVSQDYYHQHPTVQFRVVGHGFWCGILCIVAGGIGVGAANNKTVCLIRAFMVLSIISAVMCLGQLTTGILGAIVLGDTYNYDDCDKLRHSEELGGIYTRFCTEVQTLLASEILLAIFAVVGGAAAIWASVLCCVAACCCRGPPQAVVYQSNHPMTVTTHHHQQQQQQQVPSGFPAAQPNEKYY